MSAPFATLSYSLPDAFPADFWQSGMRALAPVGRTLRSGVILELLTENPLPATVKCRPVLFPLETAPLVNDGLLALVIDLANRQGLEPGAVLGHALPAGLREADLRVAAGGLVYRSRDLADLPPCAYQELASAVLAGAATLGRTQADIADCEIWSLAIDPPWPLRPAAARQIALLDFLHEHGPASRRALLRQAGSGRILQALAEKKYIVSAMTGADETDETEDARLLPPPEAGFALNDEQQAALDDLVNALHDPRPQTRLLYGVTGSGKTAVYLELARACLEAGKPCILLAPEVALAHKLRRDAAAHLPGAEVFLYHGYQHPLQRERLFRAIRGKNGPYLVIGTRSALFLPFADPGCIILDEEHDSSYKQDENLPYHAKELAWQRARRAKALLVLGSATPDIRTFQAAENGLLPRLCLPARVNRRGLPPLELISLAPGAGFSATPADQGLLAPESEQALVDCMRRGEQAVVLLNRRGYAPLIHCLGCGQTLKCPQCQIGLAFHKSTGRLVCHYCGHSVPWPSPCWHCGNSNYISIGEGTERIGERLEALAGQPVLRLDRDSSRRPGSVDEILCKFSAGASPFLVGTQMLSKGHHFPNVTLVVVADGDIGLNLPDYRAAERTFQLLAQSAGRAGRGQKPGKALIQTRNPEHYCWQHLLRYDYEGFYADELRRRQKYRYPPFTRLGLLRLSWQMNDEAAANAAQELGRELGRFASGMELTFMGPAPAPIAYIKGRKRLHCLLKAKDWQPMRELWFFAQKHKAAKRVRIFLDLDPVNMM